jgi:4a-hydroxytetrahydrobiopterin dehydratase
MATGESLVIPEAEIASRLARDLPRWRHEAGHLVRRYRTAGWKATLMVANTIGHLAEAAWHHPDLVLSYAAVEVRLTTHDAKGITAKDFELAQKIESVVGWQPGAEGGALSGTPAGDAGAAYIRYDA